MALTVLLLVGIVHELPGQESADSGERMLAALERRLEDDPSNGSTWRLVGRMRWKRGDRTGAERALRRAVELAPLSAAAHADLGRALVDLGEEAEARTHLEAAIDLAPESDYAEAARRSLETLPDAEAVTQVAYEIRRFDNADLAESRLPDDPEHRADVSAVFSDYGVWVEAGLLYNTNVALSPSSRELAPGNRDSLQFLLAPEVEWRALNTPTWRAGPTFGGNLTLNGGDFDDFNLQSYRPGIFVSRDTWCGGELVVPRVQYEFTHDEFDGRTFANRHAITTSVTRILPGDDAWSYYWSIDHTNFAEDGDVPAVTSRDGWTNALGVSRDWRFAARHWKLLRLGLDVQRADVDGSDYRFNGASVFARAVLPMTTKFEAVLQGSVGYRDYFDYAFTPSRDEVVWRVGGEIRRYFSEDLWLAMVFGYDRFDSDSPLFAAKRTTAGLVLTYRR